MAERAVYGGQAVIEGVMMRGLRFFAVACRTTDGRVVVRTEEVPRFFTRFAWARWPFLRGVFALADALVLGMKALVYSANLAMESERRGKGGSPGVELLLGPLMLFLGAGTQSIGAVAITGTAISGLLMGIAIFMLLPSVVAGWLQPVLPPLLTPALLEGIVRVGLVLGYISGVGRLPEVQRVFQYHGAEHQAINAWEQEGQLSVEAAARASRIHPRCGTNFVLTVLLVKGLIFAALPFQAAVLPRLALRLALLPVIASVAFELIRLAGRYRQVAPLQWLVAPGLWTQRLTTREPDEPMLEVAVTSLRSVMDAEQAAATDEAEQVAPSGPVSG